jgi:predicted acetyltransferase
VLAAHRATSPEYPSFLHFHDERMPFRRYLDVLDDARRGRLTGPDDDVPETFLFAFVEGQVVGRAALRHRLTPALEREGGTSAMSSCRPAAGAATPPRSCGRR